MESTINPNRYIPSSMNAHYENESGSIEVFWTTTPINNKFYSMAFFGKSKKHSYYYSHASEDSMNKIKDEFIETCKKREEEKKQVKEKQKQMNSNVTCKVGDIFVSSGGYDQTNVEFLQVVDLKGKTIKVKEITSKMTKVSEGFMSCRLSPVKDSFVDDTFMTKRISADYNGQPTFKGYWGYARLTSEDQSHYCSWYA